MHLQRIGVIALLFFMLGCVKQPNKPNWDVDVVAPLVKVSLGLEDLLADSLLQVNSNQSITLIYETVLEELKVEDFIEIPDTTIETKIVNSLPVVLQVPPGQTVWHQTYDAQYDLDDLIMFKVVAKTGNIKIDILSSINKDGIYTINVPNSNLNGAPFSESFDVPEGSLSNMVTVHQEYDISNYAFDLRGPLSNSFNNMQVNVMIQTNENNVGNAILTNQDTVFINTTFKNLVPSYLRGYTGNRVMNFGPELVSFNGFNGITGLLDIDQVEVTLKLENSIGIDARVRLTGLKAVNSISGNSVSLNHAVIGSDINITRANDNNGTVISTFNEFELNNGNSNIDAFIENLPNQVEYELEVESNPLGNVSNSNDFAYDFSSFKTSMNIKLPLNIIANDLELQDTIDFTVTSNLEDQALQYGTFKLFAENGFPLEANLQFFFLDINNNVIDSLFTNTVITAANTDANMLVTSPENSVLEIPLSASKLKNMHGTTRIAIRSVFNTPNTGQHMEIYSHYKLDLQLTGDFMYNVNLE